MNPEHPSVVIAGCGDLGTEAGRRFVALGHRVVGLRRSAARLPAEIEGVSIDLRHEVPVIPGDTGIVVIALAAGERSAEAYRATYFDGLRNVLDGMSRAGVEARVVLVSSTAVYSDDDGSVVDENTPALAATPTAEVLRETEQLLHERVPAGIVLRLGGIYGPGRERLITQVRTGQARLPLKSSHTNRIHRDDAAAAVVHLATAVADPAPFYLGVDDEPAELAEVLTYLAGLLGVPVPPAAAAAAGVTTGSAAPARPGDKRCSNALLRSTGFDFLYPTFREGYRALHAP